MLAPPNMDIVTVLKHARPFAQAPEQAIDAIAPHAVTRTFERDEAVWMAGSATTHFCVIHRGLVKIVRPLPNGRDAIMGLFGPRESVGDIAVIQGGTFPASAIVCSESATLIRIPREVILEQMHRWPGLAVSMNAALADRVQTLQTKVQILSAGGVEARLASLLLDLAERFGDELDDDTVVIPIALARQDLANLVSTTLETTIRVMSRWQKAGWVDTKHDGFVLRDVGALKDTARSVLASRSSP
jgi:CRP-like cAMP-binding protein